ncbi:MAG: hypothetical protein SGILL_009461 [Bacillariaceae sp.]
MTIPSPSTLLCLLSLLCKLSPSSSFQTSILPTNQRRQSTATLLEASATEIATLTEETTWNLRLVLQNLPTAKGKKVDQLFTIKGQFIEEEGYEPPQGVLKQIKDNQDDVTITNSRWTLSEDPEDRKDSLWIWGLFADPLYPFLLLQMEVDEVKLPGEQEDSIPAFKLFAQIDHKRENGEVMLSNGADLKIKKKETMKADPFGAATVDIFEDISVGKLQLSPILSKN